MLGVPSVIVKPEDMQNTTTKSILWLNRDKIPLLRKEISRVVKFRKKHGMVQFLHSPELFAKYFENDVVKRTGNATRSSSSA